MQAGLTREGLKSVAVGDCFCVLPGEVFVLLGGSVVDCEKIYTTAV